MKAIEVFNSTLGNKSQVTYIGRLVLLPLFLVCIIGCLVYDACYYSYLGLRFVYREVRDFLKLVLIIISVMRIKD